VVCQLHDLEGFSRNVTPNTNSTFFVGLDRHYFGTPGVLASVSSHDQPVREQPEIPGRYFWVSGPVKSLTNEFMIYFRWSAIS